MTRHPWSLHSAERRTLDALTGVLTRAVVAAVIGWHYGRDRIRYARKAAR